MAGSSITITQQVSKDDMKALWAVGATVNVNFDATHSAAIKDPHFDIGVIINSAQLKQLGKNHSGTFSKLRFGTQEVQKSGGNQIKLEVTNWNSNMIPSGKMQSVEHAISLCKAGKNGGFINNVLTRND